MSHLEPEAAGRKALSSHSSATAALSEAGGTVAYGCSCCTALLGKWMATRCVDSLRLWLAPCSCCRLPVSERIVYLILDACLAAAGVLLGGWNSFMKRSFVKRNF